MTTLAITGINSYFARMVLPRLQSDPDIDKIIGIDIAPFGQDVKKVDFFREAWEKKLALIPRERDNPIQFLHEDELGEALYLSVKRDVPGIFNIAADDSSSMQDLYEIAGIKTIKVSTKWLKTITNVLFALRLYHFSQGWVSLGAFPIIVNNEKFKKKTGWQPRYTTEGAFRDLLRSIG
jgi:UDP-glucose 4-epimerase